MIDGMTGTRIRLIVNGISLPFRDSDSDITEYAAKIYRRAGIDVSKAVLNVGKKSVDARHKDDIRHVASVIAEFDGDTVFDREKLEACGIKVIENEEIVPVIGGEPLMHPPLVVGMGPAGLFAALTLAEQGYNPIIIDRGGDVEERTLCVGNFNRSGILDPECNIQFGAGGAGTFSDGKLITRINDGKCSYVLEKMKSFGAPEDITVSARPHIGTDVLKKVISNILVRIKELGGHVIYRCRLNGFDELPDGSLCADTSRREILCGAMILAPGNGARDTYGMLLSRQFDIQAKPISVGVRIEHRRTDIDRALYGKYAGHPALGAAEYNLSDTTGDRGIYTFCMCPGGSVVAAASEYNTVVVNGMSERKRDWVNSNCAVAVSVRCSDYEPVNGSLVMGAIEFQRRIERAAFMAGGSDYSVPVQLVGDFLSNQSGHEPGYIIPTYMNGKWRCSSLYDIFPDFITDNLARGLRSFEKKLPGFARPDAVLSAAETRTSAPVRILRGDDLCAVGHKNIYPCGEGAGYAGGITSASVDGIRAALALMSRNKPQEKFLYNGQ